MKEWCYGATEPKRSVIKSGEGFFKRILSCSRDTCVSPVSPEASVEAMSDFDDDLMDDDEEYDLVSV